MYLCGYCIPANTDCHTTQKPFPHQDIPQQLPLQMSPLLRSDSRYCCGGVMTPAQHTAAHHCFWPCQISRQKDESFRDWHGAPPPLLCCAAPLSGDASPPCLQICLCVTQMKENRKQIGAPDGLSCCGNLEHHVYCMVEFVVQNPKFPQTGERVR